MEYSGQVIAISAMSSSLVGAGIVGCSHIFTSSADNSLLLNSQVIAGKVNIYQAGNGMIVAPIHRSIVISLDSVFVGKKANLIFKQANNIAVISNQSAGARHH